MVRLALLGVALLVVGLLAAGAGVAAHVQGRQCELVQTVTVAEGAADAPADLRRVDYADLSPAARAVFDEALAAEGSVLASRDGIDPAVVTREGRSYRVRVSRRNDCAPLDAGTVRLPVAAGAALVVAGAALIRGRG